MPDDCDDCDLSEGLKLRRIDSNLVNKNVYEMILHVTVKKLKTRKNRAQIASDGLIFVVFCCSI